MTYEKLSEKVKKLLDNTENKMNAGCSPNRETEQSPCSLPHVQQKLCSVSRSKSLHTAWFM